MSLNVLFLLFQVKYKEVVKKEASSCLYSKLPETLETQHAKDASQLQSQVRPNMQTFKVCPKRLKSVRSAFFFLQVKYKQEVSSSLYHQLPETTETQLAKELRDVYSQVRKSGKQSDISVERFKFRCFYYFISCR